MLSVGTTGQQQGGMLSAHVLDTSGSVLKRVPLRSDRYTSNSTRTHGLNNPE